MAIPLSQAIRLGAMLKPQAFGYYSREATCALGAALEAICCPVPLVTEEADAVMDREFPVQRRVVQHPVSGLTDEMGYHIADLNDRFRWTREQIADWVETLEAAQPAADQPQPVRVEV